MARIIVAGYMVRYPLGGQLWAHLQYLLGLKQLGHDVYFFEDFGWQDSCYDPAHNTMSDDAAYGVTTVRGLMQRFDLAERWVYRDAAGIHHGLSARESVQVIRRSDLLINLSGVTRFDGFENIPQRVFIDEDPAFTQFRAASDHEFWNLLNGHPRLYSYGQNIGQAASAIPTLGLKWEPFRQPIVLDEWPNCFDENAGAFTTVMSWNAYGNVEHEGQVYGQKSHEFPKVIDLPRRVPQRFELATGGGDVPVDELAGKGWALSDPLAVSRSVDTYRDYIQRSRGEFSVAKHAYVKTRSGWFSDRSAAYLSSGKPVVLQDTGFSAWLPTGEGLLAFDNLEEAVAAIESVNGNYARQCRAARALAEEFFGAQSLLSRLLARR